MSTQQYLGTQQFTVSDYNTPSALVNKPVDISVDFGNSSLFQDTTDLQMAITKFQLPISTVPIMRITDTDLYKISMICTVPTEHSTASTRMYKGESSMPLTSEWPIYSTTAFLDQLNKTLIKTYQNLLENVDSGGNYVKTVSLNNQTFSSGAGTRKALTFGLGTGLFCPSCELTISDITNGGALIDGRVTILLENNNGLGCRVATGIFLEAGKTYKFSSVYNQRPEELMYSEIYNNGQADGTLEVNSGSSTVLLNPQDNFAKFSTDGALGNWHVSIIKAGDSGTLNLTCDVSLKLWTTYCGNYTTGGNFIGEYAPAAPYYSLDKTSGKFTLHCEERWIQSGVQIYLGSGLNPILSLAKRNIFGDGSIHLLDIPQCTLSTGVWGGTDMTFKMVEFEQDTPKQYLLSEIESIVINSNSLPIVNRDLVGGNFSSQNLTSFSVDSDLVQEFNSLSYAYEGNSFPYRMYTLSPNREISSINVTAFARYRDGSQIQLSMLPRESCLIQFTFFKASR